MGRRVLLVDDESHVLDGLRRQLRNQYDICTALSGKAGLELVKMEAPFDVIVSDMRMPEMCGTAFLEEVQRIAPNSVRMMLTGNADQQTAVDAINKGSIYRFVSKPADPEVLVGAIEACGRQHDLLVAEKELLESTLFGCVRVLMDILSIANPEAFGRAQTLKTRASLIARHLNVPEVWQIELAAMLSTIGMIVIPPSVVVKHRSGQELNDYEQRLISRIPTLGAGLLSQIPRLQAIAKILELQDRAFTEVDINGNKITQAQIPIESRILRILNDVMDQEDHGHAIPRAFFILRSSKVAYDPDILILAEQLLLSHEQKTEPQAIPVSDLAVGMRLAANVMSKEGLVLVARGTPVSAALLERIRSSAPYYKIVEPIFIERQI